MRFFARRDQVSCSCREFRKTLVRDPNTAGGNIIHSLLILNSESHAADHRGDGRGTEIVVTGCHALVSRRLPNQQIDKWTRET